MQVHRLNRRQAVVSLLGPGKRCTAEFSTLNLEWGTPLEAVAASIAAAVVVASWCSHSLCAVTWHTAVLVNRVQLLLLA